MQCYFGSYVYGYADIMHAVCLKWVVHYKVLRPRSSLIVCLLQNKSLPCLGTPLTNSLAPVVAPAGSLKWEFTAMLTRDKTYLTSFAA